MQIQFESIDEPIKHIKPLQIATNEVESVEMGQVLSWKLLEKVGIQDRSLKNHINT